MQVESLERRVKLGWTLPKTMAAERAIAAVAKGFVDDNRKAVPSDFFTQSVLLSVRYVSNSETG